MALVFVTLHRRFKVPGADPYLWEGELVTVPRFGETLRIPVPAENKFADYEVHEVIHYLIDGGNVTLVVKPV